MKWMFALFVALASAAHADYSAVSLAPGDVAAGGAGKAVALSAVSTNKTGTLTVKRVTPLALSWTEERTTATTNFTYRTEPYRAFSSNLVYVATNADYVAVRGGTTNAAWTAAWPTNTIVTNAIVSAEVSFGYTGTVVYASSYAVTLTNAIYRTAYRVVTNATVATSTVAVPRSYYAAKTNDLCALTLSDGATTTNFSGVLILPGDFLSVTGTALPGGNAQLIIER